MQAAAASCSVLPKHLSQRKNWWLPRFLVRQDRYAPLNDRAEETEIVFQSTTTHPAITACWDALDCACIIDDQDDESQSSFISKLAPPAETSSRSDDASTVEATSFELDIPALNNDNNSTNNKDDKEPQQQSPSFHDRSIRFADEVEGMELENVHILPEKEYDNGRHGYHDTCDAASKYEVVEKRCLKVSRYELISTVQ